MTRVPATMSAVLLRAYDGKPESVEVAEVPVPQPGPGEVLVRLAAAPVNPSDLMFMQGLYGFKKGLPTILGFEGSGTVVAAGRGILPRLLLGRRVACAAADPNARGGTWAEYLATRATLCIPLHKDVDLDRGATLLVNPLTAWGLMEQARRGRHRAVVQTAAASALGRMVVRLGRKFSIATINVVRRAEQVETLKALGAEHVLDSSEPGFDDRLRELCHATGATIGFDAVAGETSGRILRAQPERSRLLVYGALSQEPVQIDPFSLIFERKHVEGFLLTLWLRRKNLLSQLRTAGRVQRLLDTDLTTEIRAKFPLRQARTALAEYANHMSAGKVLFVP
ncbi:MAG TPA: zinc-binding dehydrogenase [Pirellulales bacterium]|nr:zinc-binding dehydrogenase [Pirellulales bacterium]